MLLKSLNIPLSSRPSGSGVIDENNILTIMIHQNFKTALPTKTSINAIFEFLGKFALR